MNASLPLLLDSLLFVAAGVQVEGEVGPLVTRREADGLPEGEAHGVDDALASGLGGAHADGGRPAGGAHYVGGGEKSMACRCSMMPFQMECWYSAGIFIRDRSYWSTHRGDLVCVVGGWDSIFCIFCF